MCLSNLCESVIGQDRYNQLFGTSGTESRDINKTNEQDAGAQETSTDGTYRYEGGRRFMDSSDIKYLLPNDVEESDRIHQQHWMLRHAFQGNFDAPLEEALKKGITVFDSGCGPGTWTLEMAETYPNSTFVGVDASDVFPSEVVPTNCSFHNGNLMGRLPFPDNHFDFIHQRLLVAGLTAEGWNSCIKELTRILKPGGILELKEIEPVVYSAGPLTQKLVNVAMDKLFMGRGLVPSIATRLDSLLKENGYEDVSKRAVALPMNHDGKVGALCWDDFQTLCSGLKFAYLKMWPEDFGPTETEFDAYIAACAAECTEYKTVVKWYVAYGTKPKPAE